MTASIKNLSIAELLTRNASLHEAGKAALEAIQRHQINLRIFGALGRTIACEATSDLDRPLLAVALNDAIAHAEMDIDSEVAMLESCFRHEAVSVERLDTYATTRH
jgi:molybdopterin biosynthesis enzyme